MLAIVTTLLCLSATLGVTILEQKNCKCHANRKHLQTHFCEVDFAVKGKILQKRNNTKVVTYTVDIEEIFKLKRGFDLELGENSLITPADVTCTAFFPIGSTHLILGKIDDDDRLTTYSCILSPVWIAMSDMELKGVQKLYEDECGKCEIVTCQKEKEKGKCATPHCCKQVPKFSKIHECLLRSDFPLTSHDACYKRHSICKKVSSVYCGFEQTAALKACILNDNLTRDGGGESKTKNNKKNRNSKSQGKARRRPKTKKPKKNKS